MGLLIKNGIKAKLIQSNDGFDLYNLAELRFFIKKIEANTATPLISDKLWRDTKNELQERYKNSECLPLCLNMLNAFELSNEKKYMTDLIMFLHESKLEDFYQAEQGVVLVSTIHKAKGREFDKVYMMLDNAPAADDAERRKIYVGITRAKNELYIHCNNDTFDGFEIDGAEMVTDSRRYYPPEEITIQLTHRDINLGYFKDKKKLILHIQSGSLLQIRGAELYAEFNGKFYPVVKFSKGFNDWIQRLAQRGFHPIGAKVRFVVAWHEKDNEQEYAVILPEVYFGKG